MKKQNEQIEQIEYVSAYALDLLREAAKKAGVKIEIDTLARDENDEHYIVQSANGTLCWTGFKFFSPCCTRCERPSEYDALAGGVCCECLAGVISSKNSHFAIDSNYVAEFDSEGDIDVETGTLAQVIADMQRAYANDRDEYGTEADWAEVLKAIQKN